MVKFVYPYTSPLSTIGLWVQKFNGYDYARNIRYNIDLLVMKYQFTLYTLEL